MSIYIYLSLLVPAGHRCGHVQRRHHTHFLQARIHDICMYAIHYYIRQTGRHVRMCLSFVVRGHANSFGFGRLLVQYTSSQPVGVYLNELMPAMAIAAETTRPPYLPGPADPFHH